MLYYTKKSCFTISVLLGCIKYCDSKYFYSYFYMFLFPNNLILHNFIAIFFMFENIEAKFDKLN